MLIKAGLFTPPWQAFQTIIVVRGVYMQGIKVYDWDSFNKLGEAKPLEAVPPKPEDPATIMYTSGTTGLSPLNTTTVTQQYTTGLSGHFYLVEVLWRPHNCHGNCHGENQEDAALMRSIRRQVSKSLV